MAKILLAVLLGGAIGFERELHARSAGLRTHILVSLGAALVMIVGRQISTEASYDPGRIAAGVITGIGFLGAGVIIRMERGIRGLTTAASLWLVAALGITIGMDLYGVAVMAAVITIAVLLGLSRLERLLPNIIRGQVEVTLKGRPSDMADVVNVMESLGCRIADTFLQYDEQTGVTRFEFVIKVRGKKSPALLVEKLVSLEHVIQAAWR